MFDDFDTAYEYHVRRGHALLNERTRANRRANGVLAFIFFALIVAAVIFATGCATPAAHLNPRVADPPYPPTLLQFAGCSNGSSPWPGVAITCSFPKPAGAQDRVLVVAYNSGTSLSVVDDGNDAFTQFTAPALISNSAAGIYFYSTTTQGTQALTVTPYSSALTDVVILDFSGGSLAGFAPASALYLNGCGLGWSCETSPFPFQSGAIPITKSSILVGVQAGIPGVCTDFTLNIPSCTGQGNGFTVLYNTGGSGFGSCPAGCGFTVEIETASSSVVAPFYTVNAPSIPVNSAWVAEEMALQ